jgi:nucleoside-triphosphatase THEP1
MKPINILTGPIQSGKTSRLMAWVKYHQKCDGILAPVLNKQRFLYSIHHNEYRLLDANNENVRNDNIVSVGKFSFLNSTFVWAKEQLKNAMERRPKWLVIDEIGPLELRGEGLEPMIGKIFYEYKRTKNHHLILVIRENLLKKAIEHYKLYGDYIVDNSFLSTM